MCESAQRTMMRLTNVLRSRIWYGTLATDAKVLSSLQSRGYSRICHRHTHTHTHTSTTVVNKWLENQQITSLTHGRPTLMQQLQTSCSRSPASVTKQSYTGEETVVGKAKMGLAVSNGSKLLIIKPPFSWTTRNRNLLQPHKSHQEQNYLYLLHLQVAQRQLSKWIKSCQTDSQKQHNNTLTDILPNA